MYARRARGRQLLWQAALLLLIALNLGSCATTPRHNNLSSTALSDTATISVLSHPQRSLTYYKSFALLPLWTLKPDYARMQEPERYSTFFYMLRNLLENRGYRYMGRWESADLLVLADGYHDLMALTPSANHSWQPGELFPANRKDSAVIDNIKQQLRAKDWGQYDPPPISESLPAPPLKHKPYPPYATKVFVVVIERKTMRVLWTGTADGRSMHPSLIIPSQLLAKSLTQQIPLSKYRFQTLPRTKGQIGISYTIATTDGMDYYPIVTFLKQRGPAAKAGIKLFDLILAINGRPTINKPAVEIANMLVGEVDMPIHFLLRRNSRDLEVTAKFAPSR